MNLMTITQATTLTMSSREIAELTGKQHKDVMRDIRTMLDSLDISANLRTSFEGTLPDAYNRPQPCYQLDKEHTLCLVSGYDVAMRHRVMRRWRELEEKEAGAPLSTVDLLRLAAAKIEAQAQSRECSPHSSGLTARSQPARSRDCSL